MIERAFIEQGMKKIQLEQYLKKELNRAGFTGLQMVKTPLVTRIVLRVARPGLAIGKGGQNIKQLTEEIGKRFGIDNPQIEIQDIPHPELDARATVDKMVELIERGFRWKSVAFKTVKQITEAGAQGVELVLKGKLSGKGGRKRKHRIIQGYMKKVGDQVKLVDTAKASAYPKAGAIGITLRIIGPGVIFPDKVDINAEIDKKMASNAKAEEAAAEALKKEEAAAAEAAEKAKALAEPFSAEKASGKAPLAEPAKEKAGEIGNIVEQEKIAEKPAKKEEAEGKEKKEKEEHAKKEEKHDAEGKKAEDEKKGEAEKEKRHKDGKKGSHKEQEKEQHSKKEKPAAEKKGE